jgi:isoquinoline 1-oxidoreductase beta subunit
VTHASSRAGFDAQGNVTALHMRISGHRSSGRRPSNIRDGKDPVVFPGLNPPGRNRRSATRFRPADRPRDAQSARAAGFWRGVNLNQNTIYLECFIDESAHATSRTRSRSAAS